MWGPWRFDGESEGDSDGELIGTILSMIWKVGLDRYWLGDKVGGLMVGELLG